MCEGCCKKCPKNKDTDTNVEFNLRNPYGGYEGFTVSDVEIKLLRHGETVVKDGTQYRADEEGYVYEYMFGTDLRIGLLPRQE